MQQSHQGKQSDSPPPAGPDTSWIDIPEYARLWSGSIKSVDPKGRSGMGTFMGIKMSQEWPDLLIWETFFNNYTFGTFVELGTGNGGLSLFFLSQCLNRGIRFETFDNQIPIAFEHNVPQKLDLRSCFHFVDIFKEGHDQIVDIIEHAPRPLAFFFDDGDKPREWKTYAPLLHPGDFCAVHDWGTEFKEEDIAGVPVTRILASLSDARGAGWKAMWFQRT